MTLHSSLTLHFINIMEGVSNSRDRRWIQAGSKDWSLLKKLSLVANVVLRWLFCFPLCSRKHLQM
jgi:hypothetical protein